MTNTWSTSVMNKAKLIFIWAPVILQWCCRSTAPHSLLQQVWCPDAALLEYTQHTFPLLLSLPWVNTSEETEKLLSRGNAPTSRHCTNKVAWRKARWLTVFLTQCGEGFLLFRHSQFMLPKHVRDYLSPNLCSGEDHVATLRSVWCFLQVVRLTDTRINLPIKDRRCAGRSWPPVGRKAKCMDLDEKWTWNKHKNTVSTEHSAARQQKHWAKCDFEVRNQDCTLPQNSLTPAFQDWDTEQQKKTFNCNMTHFTLLQSDKRRQVAFGFGLKHSKNSKTAALSSCIGEVCLHLLHCHQSPLKTKANHEFI